MVWLRKGGSLEGLFMLGLAIRFRTLTRPAPSALGDHRWAPSAPAPPEVLRAVQAVHVERIGEYLRNKPHYRISAGTRLMGGARFEEH